MPSSRILSEDWKTIYIAALQSLSGKKKDDLEAKRARRVLRDLSDELRRARRGSAWIPTPDPHSGRYPRIGQIPYRALASAVRKNTEKPKKREAWERVKQSAKPVYAQKKPPSWETEKKAAAAAASAFPLHKGKTSWYLGKKVPGEMFHKSASGSIVSLRDVSPEEWSGRGFSPLRFSTKERSKRVLRTIREKWKKTPLPRRLATAGLVTGLASTRVVKGAQMDDKLKQTVDQHGLNFEETLCYEAGRELATYDRGDPSWWKDFIEWVRNLGADYRAKAVPEIKRELTKGTLQRIHKETDILPPIEIGGKMLRRKGKLDEDLGRFSGQRLRTMEAKLRSLANKERSAGRRERAQAIEQHVGLLQSELSLR